MPGKLCCQYEGPTTYNHLLEHKCSIHKEPTISQGWKIDADLQSFVLSNGTIGERDHGNNTVSDNPDPVHSRIS